MLKSGYEKLPESVKSRERFTIPKIKGHVEGNKTILSNFREIVQTVRRPQEHIIKFLLKELAAPGELRGANLILGRKVNSAEINEKVRKYVDNYVICSACGKPDTKITKENNVNFIICSACGNKEMVRG